MTLYDEDVFDDFDRPCDDDAAAVTSAPPEPRAVLAHVLQHLTAAFTTDADGVLDATLATLAILLSKWICKPYALRVLLIGPTGAGKTRLLQCIGEMTRVPATILPVTQLAESSWSGLQLGETARTLFPDLFTTRGTNHRITAPTSVITRPCCLLFDEADKLALVTPNNEPLDGAARAWRVGRQQTILAFADPLGVVPAKLDDVDGTVWWSLAKSIVIAAGAFPMLNFSDEITPASLIRVGYSPELIDRLGEILLLPQPSPAARRQVASVAASEMLDFARALDIDVQGIDEFIATLPAPDSGTARYVGIRGMRHFVERRVADAIAVAVARSESVACLVAGVV